MATNKGHLHNPQPNFSQIYPPSNYHPRLQIQLQPQENELMLPPCLLVLVMHLQVSVSRLHVDMQMCALDAKSAYWGKVNCVIFK